MNFPIRFLAVSLVASSMALVIMGRSIVRAQSEDDYSGVPEATSSPVSLVGTWAGTNSLCTGCTIDLDVVKQKGTSITGTFQLETGTETPGGKFNGRDSNNSISLVLHATMGSKHKCTANAMATLSDPDTMEGSFTVVRNNKHCKGTATFTLTRQ